MLALWLCKEINYENAKYGAVLGPILEDSLEDLVPCYELLNPLFGGTLPIVAHHMRLFWALTGLL